MEQLIEYFKRINGTNNSRNTNDEDSDSEAESVAEGVDDEEIGAVVEHQFTVNFDLLLKKKRNPIRRSIPPWWNDACEEALVKRKRAKKILKKMGEENQAENLKAYREAAKALKKTTKKAKQAFYKKVEKEIEDYETVVF